MIEFLEQYWHVFIRIVLLIIVILVTIFKKKVKVYDAVTTVILEILPKIIVDVEAIYGLSSKQKLDFAVSMVNMFLKENFPRVDPGSYYEFIVESIEKILSTPKKKEVSNER